MWWFAVAQAGPFVEPAWPVAASRLVGIGDVDGDGFGDLGVDDAFGEIWFGGPRRLDPDSVRRQGPIGYHFVQQPTLDFDGDGYGDVLGVDIFWGEGLTVQYGGPAGLDGRTTWFEQVDDQVQFDWGDFPCGADFDQDGFDDLAFSAYDVVADVPQVFVFPGGPGGLDPAVSTALDVPETEWIWSYVLSCGADTDGDGFPDLAVIGDDPSRTWMVYPGGPRGVARRSGSVLATDEGLLHPGRPGDLDGDGTDDLVGWGGYFHMGQMIAFGGPSGLSSGRLLEEEYFDLVDSEGSAVDVDRDGVADLLIPLHDTQNGSDGLIAIHHGGPGGPAAVADEFVPAGFLGRLLAPGDLNGDGVEDLISWTGNYSADLFYGALDDDLDGLPSVDDCDDGDAAVGGPSTWHADADGDGSGDPAVAREACAELGWVQDDRDCDDADPVRSPTAAEVPGDGVDQDCDGAEACFVDADEDGARSELVAASTALDCKLPGLVGAAAAPDCDDEDADVVPGAAETLADGVDMDCDGTERCLADDDRDGAASQGEVASADPDCDDAGEAGADADPDCDDGDPATRPGAPELPGDGVDQDCDGAELCYVDGDADGARGTEVVPSDDVACDSAGEAADTAPADCDDADPARAADCSPPPDRSDTAPDPKAVAPAPPSGCGCGTGGGTGAGVVGLLIVAVSLRSRGRR